MVAGLHDLQLYANDHWLEHLEQLVEIGNGSFAPISLRRALGSALDRLCSMHHELANMRHGDWTDSELISLTHGRYWEPLNVSPTTAEFLALNRRYRNIDLSGAASTVARNGMCAALVYGYYLIISLLKNHYQLMAKILHFFQAFELNIKLSWKS